MEWQTATETNNQGFDIERKIIVEQVEGEWMTIGFKDGAGTTAIPQHYSYYDDISDIQASSFVYRLKQIDYNGSFEYSEEVIVNNSVTPDEYFLSQNYPNPFNPSTTISYSISEMEFVTLKVYDFLGSEVAILVDEEKPAGTYKVEWNATDIPSGVYFYKLQTNGFIETKKMMLLK